MENDQQFLDKWNININLVRENEEDVKIASLFKFNTVEKPEESKIEKRKIIESESIFENFSKKISTDKTQDLVKSSNTKVSCVESLKKQINKSVKNETISSNGFGSNTLTTPNKAYSSLSNSVVVKKPNEKSPLVNNEKPSALVSNDYGSSSDSE